MNNQGRQTPGLVPLNISAVGHRDIVGDDVPRITLAVTNFFKKLLKQYPDTPLKCYTGLAVGADQLVAAVVRELRIPMIAVLPVPEAEYRRYFLTDEIIGDFDTLLANASEIVVLRETDPNGFKDLRDPLLRDKEFATLGSFLSDRSQILLALYDKIDVKRPGGTAWIVERKREGRHQLGATKLDLPETGLVYVIPVRRESALLREVEGIPNYSLHVGESIMTYLTAFADINLLNQRMARIPRSDTRDVLSHHASLFEFTLEAADHLARADKITLDRIRLILFSLAFAMFASYLTYANFFATVETALVFFSAQVTGLIVWTSCSSRQLLQRFVEYRTFCETLRVQQAWSESKLKRNTANYFLRKHYPDLRWIRLALHAVVQNDEVLAAINDERKAVDGATTPEVSEIDWIKKQATYFSRALFKKRRVEERIRAIAASLYIIGLLASFASVIAIRFFPDKAELAQALVISMGAFPGIAALILAYADSLGWTEDVNQYRHMSDLFSRGVKLRGAVPQDDLVLELGREVLRHNGDWLSAHSARPIKPPSL